MPRDVQLARHRGHLTAALLGAGREVARIDLRENLAALHSVAFAHADFEYRTRYFRFDGGLRDGAQRAGQRQRLDESVRRLTVVRSSGENSMTEDAVSVVAAGGSRFRIAWAIAMARITTATTEVMMMRFLVFSLRDRTDFTDWRYTRIRRWPEERARRTLVAQSAN
nr:hypothetical protein [Paraburkholderia kirstenboschensis]